jgi:Zn-finger nucleic acid-binding protein
MNFISAIEGREIPVELKYCERCGGLWLRRRGADGVYCAGCRAHLEAMPNPGEAPTRKRRLRRKVRAQEQRTDIRNEEQGENLQNPALIEYLEGVAAMEVRV